jgi:hypothetical protein
MRFRYLLPATILVAGSAFAQTGASNAIGVWNSSTFGFIGWYIGTGFAAGATGNSMWSVLPAEVTTHFGNTTGYGAATSRSLSWRGYECSVTHFNSLEPSHDGPTVELRTTVPNGASPQRWLPDFTAGGLYATVAGVPALIPGGTPAGTHYRISATLAGAASVPAGSATGQGIAWVWKDFQTQYGDGGGLHVTSTVSEPTGPGVAGISYSGGTAGAQNFILPNFAFGGGPASGEYCVTHLFEDAMIQPVKNANIITSGGTILGGGSPPAPFTVSYNNGRGAIHAVAGDSLTYNGNSRLGSPVQGSLGTTYFVPFVLFSGDLGVGDPVNGSSPYSTPNAGEVWNSGAIFVYGSPLRSWIDDFCVLSGACPAGTGAIINPANSSWAFWQGIDSQAIPFALNFNVLLNGLGYADVSQGPNHAGPTSVAFDSAAAPLGLLARNPVNGAAGFLGAGGAAITTVSEFSTMLNPQAGYSPSLVGKAFGTYPGGLPGTYFAIQCWMMDLNTNTVTDMSNMAIIRQM